MIRYNGKYQITDKVRVRKWENIERDKHYDDGLLSPKGYYGTLCKKEKIGKFSGKVVTIARVESYGYRIEEDDGEALWIDEMFEGYAFNYGDKILVSNSGKTWREAYYVGYNDGAERPYVVVILLGNGVTQSMGEDYGYVWLPEFKVTAMKYAKPIKTKHNLILDGNKEYVITEESYKELMRFLEAHAIAMKFLDLKE